MATIIEDTRQKKDKHQAKHDAWDADGTTVLRCGLAYGDYWPAPRIAIDTKADLSEIAMNLCGAFNERKRVQREIVKAETAGTKLIFLVEDSDIRSIDDLRGRTVWMHSGRSISGDQLANAMTMHENRYGCEFRFCEPAEAGRVIKELLDDGR